MNLHQSQLRNSHCKQQTKQRPTAGCGFKNLRIINFITDNEITQTGLWYLKKKNKPTTKWLSQHPSTVVLAVIAAAVDTEIKKQEKNILHTQNQYQDFKHRIWALNTPPSSEISFETTVKIRIWELKILNL